MEIYFKCTYKPQTVEAVIKEITASSSKIGNDVLYKVSLKEDHSLTRCTILPKQLDYIIQIHNQVDLDRFVRIMRGEELARFNSNKPKYSYIDFRLFEDMHIEGEPLNVISYSGIEYVTFLLSILSSVSFTKTSAQKVALKNLRVIGYKASLALNNIQVEQAGISLKAFDSMAAVLEYGAQKYDRDNWRKPSPNKLSSADSLYRHIDAILEGEELDKDSGFQHIGHILCNIMFLTYHLTYESHDK